MSGSGLETMVCLDNTPTHAPCVDCRLYSHSKSAYLPQIRAPIPTGILSPNRCPYIRDICCNGMWMFSTSPMLKVRSATVIRTKPLLHSTLLLQVKGYPTAESPVDRMTPSKPLTGSEKYWWQAILSKPNFIRPKALAKTPQLERRSPSPHTVALP